MATVNRMQGVSSTLTYLKSDGERRHRSRCKNFKAEETKCTYLGTKCVGSSRCLKYKERTESEAQRET